MAFECVSATLLVFGFLCDSVFLVDYNSMEVQDKPLFLTQVKDFDI